MTDFEGKEGSVCRSQVATEGFAPARVDVIPETGPGRVRTPIGLNLRCASIGTFGYLAMTRLS